MIIRLEQLNPIIGDINGNLTLIEEAIANAEADNVDLLVLPELVVCGYSPMDLIEHQSFLDTVYQANDRLKVNSRDTAVLFGTITPNNNATGRNCFNSALLVQNGYKIAEVHKTLLPTYDVYDELRYFEPNNTFECIEFKGTKIGITICEDIWHNFELPYVTYDVNPAKELVERGAEAIFNLSASPYTKDKPHKRQKMLQQHAQRLGVPIFYANQIGGNTELVSDGDSMTISSDAEVVGRAPLFDEAHIDFKWNPKADMLENVGPEPAEVSAEIAQMFNALRLGLQDYLDKTGIADDVVLGLSGGIDSALVAAIATEALGAENVVGITMPSKFSSEGSVTDSEQLAHNLGIELHEIAVKDLYDQFNVALDPLLKDSPFGVAEENLQPRIRGTLLMAYSNKFGNMLLNTGNKSELATGYCTLYGDMAGGLGVIADLYKLEVYEMAHWLNEEYYGEEVIPSAIINKPPSAELRPAQKDADSLPKYDILDLILEAYIEKRLSITEIADQGFDIDTVQEIVALVDRNEYKRFQAVPAIKVSDKAFGSGRRWPLVQRWTSSRN
ncbi:NAD+ synthase [Aliifodinibius salipaludis]|uniref:Glutamine-dependent NAD(+) synthetase n=1 Tax=Fodinibius salipaludis TaxID=2032627 RepID=A0A2A2G6X2_9BACT|nr:NAD+ synthase [Aliifodinibius salipaludis]PAU93381.1 NAD+ synthase [Aliifodinibius salipaludis]